MSTVVGTIHAGILTRAAVVLTGWSKLVFVHDLTRNATGTAANRYGVRVLDGQQVPGATCAYTVDQSFELVLTTAWVSTVDGDNALTTAINTLEQKAHAVFTNLIKTKCGATTVVLQVRDLNLGEAELIEDDKMIALRARFTVQYRVSTL